MRLNFNFFYCQKVILNIKLYVDVFDVLEFIVYFILNLFLCVGKKEKKTRMHQHNEKFDKGEFSRDRSRIHLFLDVTIYLKKNSQ
jgi:hypothetical protein